MTAHITLIDEPPLRRIRVAGKLAAAEALALEAVIGPTTDGVRLELDELRAADADALVLLRRLQAEGVVLSGVAPRFRWRLELEPV